MAYCELLYQNSLSLLEILEWIIDANLVIIYLLTIFYINGQNHCQFYIWSLHIQIFYEFKKKKKKKIFVKIFLSVFGEIYSINRGFLEYALLISVLQCLISLLNLEILYQHSIIN